MVKEEGRRHEAAGRQRYSRCEKAQLAVVGFEDEEGHKPESVGGSRS